MTEDTDKQVKSTPRQGFNEAYYQARLKQANRNMAEGRAPWDHGSAESYRSFLEGTVNEVLSEEEK